MEHTDDNTIDIEPTAEEKSAASRLNTAIVVDTTVIIAVVTNEPTKKQLIEATLGATLVAPTSLDVEVGNAFSRMFKRQRIELEIAERRRGLINRFQSGWLTSTWHPLSGLRTTSIYMPTMLT